jgi:Mg2+/Co2+ transporter CorB
MDSSLIFYITAIVVCLAVSAFFAASETALTAMTRARIYHLVTEGNKNAEIISHLRRDKESLIGALLLGNTVVNILASVLATSLAIKLGSDDVVAAVTCVMTALVVVFAEVLPKTYAIHHPERVALGVAKPVRLVMFLLSPVTATVQWFIRNLLKLFGIDITHVHSLVAASDVVRGTIEFHHSEGQMKKQDRDMLGGILDLDDIEVRDIMVHRKLVITINVALPAQEIVRQAVASLHSRLPLWKDSPDNIIGILHVKSLLPSINEKKSIDRDTIDHITVKPWFIPETTTLRAQLIAFRQKKQHFAVVVDEYGAVQGVITLEDILEEIVGNIDDEHDETLHDMQKIGEHTYIANGSVTIRDINRELEWNLPDENASTIAGLLMHEAQQIPPVGASYERHGVRFTVETRDRTRIKRVRVEKLPDPDDASRGEA